MNVNEETKRPPGRPANPYCPQCRLEAKLGVRAESDIQLREAPGHKCTEHEKSWRREYQRDYQRDYQERNRLIRRMNRLLTKGRSWVESHYEMLTVARNEITPELKELCALYDSTWAGGTKHARYRPPVSAVNVDLQPWFNLLSKTDTEWQAYMKSLEAQFEADRVGPPNEAINAKSP